MSRTATLSKVFLGGAFALALAPSGTVSAAQQSVQGIRHAFLATGAKTYIISHKGKQLWSYPRPTREGWMLPSGNVLLVLTRGKNFPGGVVEVNREKRIIFQFRGLQHGIGSACKLKNGNYLIAHSGRHPRLLEVNPNGRLAHIVPLRSAAKNYDDQIRMARPLVNGNYLVAQLADQVVREYDRAGKVVWEVKIKHGPYAAIRLKNGHTLVGCTTGNCVVQFDRSGKVAWKLTSKDIENGSLENTYGVQRLPNGNTVVATQDAKAGTYKLVEVNASKLVVWTFADARRPGIDHFQILNTNGKPLPWPPLR